MLKEDKRFFFNMGSVLSCFPCAQDDTCSDMHDLDPNPKSTFFEESGPLSRSLFRKEYSSLNIEDSPGSDCEPSRMSAKSL